MHHLRDDLETCGERLRRRLGVSVLAISRFDPDGSVLRTLVNVGRLEPGDERLPTDERYEVDAFPTARCVLEGGTYVFKGLEDADVASAALALAFNLGPQAGVPIRAFDRIWGELWVAEPVDGDAYDEETLRRLQAAASLVGGVVEAAR